MSHAFARIARSHKGLHMQLVIRNRGATCCGGIAVVAPRAAVVWFCLFGKFTALVIKPRRQ